MKLDLNKFYLCNTGAGFERYAKKQLLKNGYKVIDLTKVKNGVPDYFIADSSPFFIECKCYRSFSTFESAIKAWKKEQPKQFETQSDIDQDTCAVYILMQTRDKTYLKRLGETNETR